MIAEVHFRRADHVTSHGLDQQLIVFVRLGQTIIALTGRFEVERFFPLLFATWMKSFFS